MRIARALDVLYAAAVPSTPQGAADKIRDAVVTLDMSDDAVATCCVRDLNPIVERLARGDRRLADVVTLRAVLALAKSRIADDDVLPALTTALEGIARPIMVAALQPSKASA